MEPDILNISWFLRYVHVLEVGTIGIIIGCCEREEHKHDERYS